MNTQQDPTRRRRLTRRDFLKLAAVTGVLTGCGIDLAPDRVAETGVSTPLAPSATTPASPTPTASATATPVPTPKPGSLATLAPTGTPQPAATPTEVPPTPQPKIGRFDPTNGSRVVRVRHASVWDSAAPASDGLSAGALRQMLDASIVALTGIEDPVVAWSALFAPDDIVAIKVNAIHNPHYYTHPALVMAVVAALGAAGVPPEQVIVYDRTTRELEDAGYTLNIDGPGVRCQGTDRAYTGGFPLVGSEVGLSDLLLRSTALINMPVLKAHSMAGITFALKNHYGTFDQPQRYHTSDTMAQALAELALLPAIADRRRLVIGDALLATLDASSMQRQWRGIDPTNALLVSFDPVATDAVALQHWCALKQAAGDSTAATEARAAPWLRATADHGAGNSAPDRIEVVDLAL